MQLLVSIFYWSSTTLSLGHKIGNKADKDPYHKSRTEEWNLGSALYWYIHLGYLLIFPVSLFYTSTKRCAIVVHFEFVMNRSDYT